MNVFNFLRPKTKLSEKTIMKVYQAKRKHYLMNNMKKINEIYEINELNGVNEEN